ncbi:hypothetical protein EDC94DRAFT_613504 [Helicostylum pulchrum]|nr:hypothetical protein EDC94DRAFT_613504 [Helicostylum pulchrum]
MIFYTSLIHRLRMARAAGILTMNNSRGTVFAITANAIAVLIVTLVNFILFVMNKKDFDVWCIRTSVGYVEYEYLEANNNTAIPQNKLSNTQDIYNCDRLFYAEVKWSLLCLVIMCIVYVHWILIVAARKAYNFYYQRSEGPPMSEFSNIAPKSKRSKTLNVFRNVKPSKSIMKELLTHRQYGEFIPSEDTFHQEKLSTVGNNENLDSNIIQFEDNLYNSKEIKPPCNAFYNKKMLDANSSNYSVSDNGSTVINFGA